MENIILDFWGLKFGLKTVLEQSLQDFLIKTTMLILKPSMKNGLDNVYALKPLPTSLKCSNRHDKVHIYSKTKHFKI